MSGGSYNYLYRAMDLGDLGERRGELTDMLNRLEELARQRVAGAREAALETRTILHHFERADRIAHRLGEVWHAVEWRDSCDWSEEQRDKVLAEYGERRRRGQGQGG